ncbi:MAG TPA: copper resistance CopC family protein [Ornithinibacter sp.]|nr:copper resistance CopC family protein [Ornithinibacter sp.]
MLSRRFATIVTIVIVVAFVVAFVAPAFASGTSAGLPVHARLTSATPADGATVERADEVVLTFNENVNPDFVAVRVTGPAGSEAGGDPSVDGRTVTQPLAADLPAGTHQVAYRVVSADGHPIAGTLSFVTTASPAAASPTTTAPSPTPTTTPSTVAASPTATATTVPASTDAGDGIPVTVIAVVGIVAAAVLGALLLLLARTRPRADDGRTPPA